MPILVDQFGTPLSSVSLTDNIYVDTGSADGRAAIQKVYDLFSNDVFGMDVQSIIRNPQNGLYYYDDFVMNTTVQALATVSGIGAQIRKNTTGRDTTNKCIGVMELLTGTTSAGKAQLAFAGLAGAPSLIPAKLGKALLIQRVGGFALSTVGEEYSAEYGWVTEHPALYGAFWKYDRVTDGDFWTCITGVTPTATKTVTSIPVTTGFIWLATVINADWSEVKFYYSTNGIGWTLAATHTTNIPQTGLLTVSTVK